MNTRHTLALILALLPAALLVHAQSYKPAFEKITLSNGMDVVFHRDTTLPAVSIHIAFRAGSCWDPSGLRGIATVSGNLLLASLPAHAASELGKIQTEATAAYASLTSVDWTNITLTYPSKYLDAGLWIESERLKAVGDAVTEVMLKQTVEYMIAQRRETAKDPSADMQEALYREMYPEGHPYAHLSTGDTTELRKITLAEVRKFMKLFHTAGNASMTISGDFRIDDAKKLVRKYFAGLPASKRFVWKTEARKFDPAGPVAMIKQAPVDFSTLQIVFPTVPLGDPDEAALQLLAKLLAGAGDARLKKLYLDNNPNVLDVTARQTSQDLHGMFTITITCRAETQLRSVFEQALTLLQTIPRTPVSEDEMSMSRSLNEMEFLLPMESVHGFGGRGDALNLGNLYTSNPASQFAGIEAQSRVTPFALREAARRYLSGASVVVLSIVPPGRQELGVTL